MRPETWNKRDLLADGTLSGIPHQGFARAMKVGREEIAGLVTAVEVYAAGSDEADAQNWSGLLDQIEHDLTSLPGI